MEWLIALSLLGVGIFLLIIELFVIPGSTVVGIAGGLMSILGIIYAYISLGVAEGTGLLALGIISGALLIVWVTKSKTWRRYILGEGLVARVNEEPELELEVGEEGITRTTCRPSGTAIFHDKEYEVHSMEGLVSAQTKIRIIDIEHSKIYVKPIHA